MTNAAFVGKVYKKSYSVMVPAILYLCSQFIFTTVSQIQKHVVCCGRKNFAVNYFFTSSLKALHGLYLLSLNILSRHHIFGLIRRMEFFW